MSVTRPDAATVDQLINMGFPANRANKAVFRTHNCGVEPAVNWLMEHGGDEDIDSPLELPSFSGRTAAEPVVGVPADITTVINPGGDRSFAEPSDIGVDCKAVLVVAAGAGALSPGDLALACTQAAVGLYKVMMANRIPWYPAFEAQGERTTILSISSGSELEQLADKASRQLLPTHLVGNCKGPAGSLAVLGVAGPSESLEKLIGKLQRLK